jgi:hypothetical protein
LLIGDIGKLNIGSQKRILSLCKLFQNQKSNLVESNTQSKKDIQNYIKKELTSILINLNPAIDKRDLKKSIKKASKVLYRGSTKKRKNNKPVEVMSTTEVITTITD